MRNIQSTPKIKLTLILPCLLTAFFCIVNLPGKCNVNAGPDITITEDTITMERMRGSWKLMYPKNYGYLFKFYRNYRAIVVIYLQKHALVFKGIYTLEANNILRINIINMKRVKNIHHINYRDEFVKAKSSTFKFLCALNEKGKILELRPSQIIIDGMTSEGYFEPKISLKKQ